MIAIAPLKWPGMNVAFLASFIGTIILALAVIPYGKRRPVGKPLRWGEAMMASTYAFGVMFLAFGICPHQWIDHCDKDLGWSTTKLIYGPGDILKPKALGGWFPMTLNYQILRDIGVVVIHAIWFGMIIFLWLWWQNRDKAAAKTPELETSSYGRPLVRKA